MPDTTEAETAVQSFEHALAGWAAIVAVVVVYDSWAILTKKQTLSSAFWRTQQSWYGKIIAGLWGGLSWHLIMGHKQVLPEKHHNLYVRVHPLHRGRYLLLRNRPQGDIV